MEPTVRLEPVVCCQVCCSNYNKTTRHLVKCYFANCGYESCKECVRTYLTSITTDPHCMKCRNKWNIEFTKTSLNASFMEKDYRVHRRKILTDTEIAKIPEYYEGALRYGKISESDKQMAEIINQIAELRNQISELYREHEQIRINMGNISQVARKFVMPCQTGGCRGMLSSQYKCDLCLKHTCPKCFIAVEGGDHICKQEDVDTVEELRKNTRPCPNCGMRISKIDGCDQMWCTECKTAFSWSKGTVEKGVVHNPHYYQWMREHGQVAVTPVNQCNQNAVFNGSGRQITEITNDCINSRRIPRIFCEVFDNMEFRTDVKNRGEKALKDAVEKYMPFYGRVKPMVTATKTLAEMIRVNSQYLTNFHRYIVHMEQVELRPLAEAIRTRTQNKYSIYRYILNEIDRELLADDLIRADTTTMKDRAFMDILDALVMVGKQILVDCMTELQQNRDPQCLELYDKFDYGSTMTNYYNPAFISQFVICEAAFPCEKMVEYHNKILKITEKYTMAIRRYCAYSTVESLRFLLIYNSRKTLPLWNYTEGRTSYHGFQNKTEIQNEIDQHRTLLAEMDKICEVAVEHTLENTFV
uniref:RING-type domain-containing protein n=1 Tax=viral metagenome TaxID=1070528 RepID=A0A6C0B6J6_9ZZZZ